MGNGKEEENEAVRMGYGWLGLGGWAGGGKREREGGRVGDVLFGESNGERQVFGRV